MVGQRPEEAVAVADGVGSIEAELTELGVEQLAVLFRVCHDRLVEISIGMRQTMAIWRLTFPLLLVVRDRTAAGSELCTLGLGARGHTLWCRPGISALGVSHKLMGEGEAVVVVVVGIVVVGNKPLEGCSGVSAPTDFGHR